MEQSSNLPADLAAALKSVFGFSSFWPNQESIVRAVMAGRDVFAVMPTGGGKSLCYQLPAYVMDGACIVVSPLISLMKDQVDAARENGIRAEVLNSSITGAQRGQVLGNLCRGELDLLYLAPERYNMEGFAAALNNARICLFAIDEAHCVSEWGHDFRPDYLSLAGIVRQFPNIPVAAFTATATPRVQQDIIERLALRNPFTVRASFDRPNLYYQVLPKENLHRQILSFLEGRPDQSGIIYRTTRDNVEATASLLTERGIKALPYHAGLDAEVRKANQDAFNRDEVNVIVATIAFGMGIDKSNVRFVLHGDLPKNLESYYQETGRSGRDGEPSHCLLYFSAGDIPKIRYFMDQITDPAERKVASDKLNQMVQYASAHACRRRMLLGYFGEEYSKPKCDTCDVCAGQVDSVDATVDAQKVMSAILRTGERFGAAHVVDVVTGADTQKVRDFRHDQLKTYGVGKDQDKHHWRRIIDDLLAQQCLARSEDQFPVLHLTDKGRAVLFGKQKLHVVRRREKPAPQPRKAKGKALATADALTEDYDRECFDELRALRRRVAQAQGVPPYIVLSDRTLHEMARSYPQSDDDLRGITGIGDVKLRMYGNLFLEAIRSYLSRHPSSGKSSPPAPIPPDGGTEAPAGRRGSSRGPRRAD